MPVRIFIHGLESSNKGTKGLFFRDKFPDMIIPHFHGSLEKRMKELNRILEGKSAIRLVGSSFGGLMATLFALDNEARVENMVLLAPALNLMGSELIRATKPLSRPVRIYHGTDDHVIPIDRVEPVAKMIFSNISFHPVDDDHFLHRIFKTIPWDNLLA